MKRIRCSFCALLAISSLTVVFLYGSTALETLKIKYYEFYPKEENKDTLELKLWFDPETPYDDRILTQKKHVPKAYQRSLDNGIPIRNISILKYYWRKGTTINFNQCPVNSCEVTNDKSRMSTVDAIIFEFGHPNRTPDVFPSSQIWIVYKFEGPLQSSGLKPGDQFNWTATFRPDSTLPIPHFKFIPNAVPAKPKRLLKNFAKGKTKKVAWFVSHCETPNKRMEYARELQKHIPVDIYGKCGNYSCKRGKEDNCFRMLQRDYKFYLSFENSNCRHYITEKFAINALMTKTLPIVMGAPKEDYVQRAPPNSFIHVDDFESPRHLAEYLHVLDNNDWLYSSYFQWEGTGRIMRSGSVRYWCRVCALLHEQQSNPRPPTWYEDTNEWWRGKGVCIGADSWRNHTL